MVVQEPPRILHPRWIANTISLIKIAKPFVVSVQPTEINGDESGEWWRVISAILSKRRTVESLIHSDRDFTVIGVTSETSQEW
jgi:hypothetical protein